jgi:alkanesulfonate monooxygenase SsuD/methylene tetrahydromethanopterin reductase-like flavin-dependent oxidoreductase (luciferase family)
MRQQGSSRSRRLDRPTDWICLPFYRANEGAAMRRQLKLSVYMHTDGNYHHGAWRMPGVFSDAGDNVQRWIEIARLMERGKFDMLFIPDNISPPGVDHIQSFSHSARAIGFEPLTLLSALASVTTHLGLAATAATTWHEPYVVARMFASLDHLSHGRAGWNLVTGRNPRSACRARCKVIR